MQFVISTTRYKYCTRYKYFNTYKEYIKAVLVISTKSKILITSKLVISSTYNEFVLLISTKILIKDMVFWDSL